MLSDRSVLRALLSLFLLGGTALCFSAIAQTKPAGSSGHYESLLIGVDENSRVVTGYFEESTGWNERTQSPQFTCAFFLFGKLEGDLYPITTWYPGLDVGEPIRGQLKFLTVDGVLKAHVKLEQDPGGCGMAHSFMRDGGGDEFPLSTPGKWSSVRVVSAKRAFFHQRPDPGTKGRAYVVRENIVRVFKIQNGWVEAEFTSDTRKIVRGWLKESDLFALIPK
jgi:hypothetical protein